MKTFRPLKPQELQALQDMSRNDDAHREALQRELYELEHSRVPLYRIALERILFRQLLHAARQSPYKSRALARVLDRIPHASSRLEWEKLAPDERHDRLLDVPPDET